MEVINVIINVGQSNCRGLGDFAAADASLTGSLAPVKIVVQSNLSSSAVPHTIPVASAKADLKLGNNWNTTTLGGIELSMAKSLNTKTKEKVLINKYAFDSRSLFDDGAAGVISFTSARTDELYGSLLKQTYIAIQPFLKRDVYVKFFVIFIQGEEDAINLTRANAYNANLLAFITGFEAAVSKNMKDNVFSNFSFEKWIFWKLISPTLTYASTINTAFQNRVISDPNKYLIYDTSEAGLTFQPDNLHYNLASLIQGGGDMANLISSFIYKYTPPPIDFTTNLSSGLYLNFTNINAADGTQIESPDKISKWLDFSPDVRVHTQGSSAIKPLLQIDGVKFDGINDYLFGTNYNNFATFAQSFAIGIRFKMTSVPALNSCIWGTNRLSLMITNAGKFRVNLQPAASNKIFESSGVYSDDTWKTLVIEFHEVNKQISVWDSTNTLITSDGINVGSFAGETLSALAGVITLTTLGCRNNAGTGDLFANVKVSKMLIYKGVTNSTIRTNMIDELLAV